VPEIRRTLELTDPRALRAVAHPVRLALVGLLRRQGPLTATQAAAHVGESPSSCSFHLRQLARYGLVEDAGGGRGRERPWRATALFTSWADTPSDPELAAAADQLTTVVGGKYIESIRAWLARRGDEPAAWREATPFGDTMLFVTAEELRALDQAVAALYEPYLERTAKPELRPPGARAVIVLRVAYPADDPPPATT
jgi:predicted ArsR family transcriptional regulator